MGTKQGSARPGRCLPAGLPHSLPPSRLAVSGEAGRARALGRPADAEPGLQGGGRPREVGPRSVKEEKHPKACRLLRSAFFFHSSCLGEKKKKKETAALPLKADAKRMQNFNRLLHGGFPQWGLGPGLAWWHCGRGLTRAPRASFWDAQETRPSRHPQADTGPHAGV